MRLWEKILWKPTLLRPLATFLRFLSPKIAAAPRKTVPPPKEPPPKNRCSPCSKVPTACPARRKLFEGFALLSRRVGKKGREALVPAINLACSVLPVPKEPLRPHQRTAASQHRSPRPQRNRSSTPFAPLGGIFYFQACFFFSAVLLYMYNI